MPLYWEIPRHAEGLPEFRFVHRLCRPWSPERHSWLLICDRSWGTVVFAVGRAAVRGPLRGYLTRLLFSCVHGPTNSLYGMHLLYVDDSGSVGNPNETYFVLGGVAVFERGVYHVIKALDDVVEGFGLGGSSPDVELHGTVMYAGRDRPWNAVKRPDREGMIKAALNVISGQRAAVRLFGVAVNKAHIAPRDPVEYAFEEICNRFNLFLRRENNRQTRSGEAQRGLVIMDEMRHEQPLQALARHFRANGTRWGALRNMAEVPLFVDSRASRLVQLADLVAYAIFRKYEISDGRFFDALIPFFDSEGGVIHGLVHARPKTVPCFCPSCMSRNYAQKPKTILGQ